MDKEKNFPTVLVILGATGDLSAKKIFPSLIHLFEKNKLPRMMSIVGFSRRDWSDEQFRQHVKKALKKHKKRYQKKKIQAFLKKVSYCRGDFTKLGGYKRLAQMLGQVDNDWSVCANKLFYLAVPPKYYKKIFVNLEKSGLTEPCSPEEGWTRIIVEKPFGKNLKSARRLDRLLSKLFKEEQIFRIDHYLAKDMLQNILAFRFSNNLFEHSWNAKNIEKIEVKILEKIGVVDRGTFYDGVGALRDVGQNHLLQMLALSAMDTPNAFGAESIREKRAELLGNIKVPDEGDIQKNTFRAQYKGYKKVEGVEKKSKTETYFKLKGFLESPKWKGIPFTLEAGKSMGENKKEIVVTFKHPTPCLCPPNSDHSSKNKVIFALEPDEEITLRLWSKKPGYSMAVEKRSFDLPYRKKGKAHTYAEEYEKLLLDCISGDQTQFVSTKELEAMWKFVDPIVEAWQKDIVPLASYNAKSKKVRKQAKEKIAGSKDNLKKEIGIIGLGKMGQGIALQLIDKGWKVVGYNRTDATTKKMEKDGLVGAFTIDEMITKLQSPKIIWLMLPAGKPTTDHIRLLSKKLKTADIVIDGSNNFYKDTQKNAKLLKQKGIEFADVGVSGGPSGARNGACLMIGGEKKTYDYLSDLFKDLAVSEGYEYFEGAGAGHFVKMVHNGIEYGMMQAIAEGFDIMKSAKYKLHLKEIAGVYNHGSVIESNLLGFMRKAFETFGDNLQKVSGSAGSGGSAGLQKSEAKWSVDTAEKLGVPAKIIKGAVQARKRLQKKPSYQGKIINALRNMFGGHDIK